MQFGAMSTVLQKTQHRLHSIKFGDINNLIHHKLIHPLCGSHTCDKTLDSRWWSQSSVPFRETMYTTAVEVVESGDVTVGRDE